MKDSFFVDKGNRLEQAVHIKLDFHNVERTIVYEAFIHVLIHELEH